MASIWHSKRAGSTRVQQNSAHPAENFARMQSVSPSNDSLVSRPRKPMPGGAKPNTYVATQKQDPGAVRKEIFDPALKHFMDAFRLADPTFSDSDIETRWRFARMEVIQHLLNVVNASRWKQHLVLRGSLLLKAWLGEAAREPGDIDWVVHPMSFSIMDRQADEMFEELAELIGKHPEAGGAVIDAAHIAVDDIWTYDRVPGRRIVFPWQLQGLPAGIVQMDIVFGENLWSAPIETLITFPGGAGVPVWGASKEVSLAWKLLWLETDSYPQGKDLYDATLLAEQTTISLRLLKQVLNSESGVDRDFRLSPNFPMFWDVDWDNFKAEYPWVEGEVGDWQTRLTAALAPTFAYTKIGLLGS